MCSSSEGAGGPDHGRGAGPARLALPPEHVLLVHFHGDSSAADAAKVEALATGLEAESHLPIRVVAIAAPATDLPEPVGYTLLRDAGEAFAHAYDAKPGMTLLVRPDGYIGLADVSPDIETISSFLRRCYG